MGEVLYYEAQVVSVNNYYPFGMGMQERVHTAPESGYRFGFNGQEGDDEVSGEGNSYTAMFWQNDSRLGRRWNVDPKPQITISSYACLNNSPVFLTDSDGDTVAESRTKGMNFMIVPTKEMAENDLAYKADRFKARLMSIMSLGKLKVIASDNPMDMVSKIKGKLGTKGYVANLTIDFHPGDIGAGDINSPDVAYHFSKLREGYAGMDYTAVYLGQCWGGGEGTTADPGNTAQFSKYLDGALVYANQAPADSKHFLFQNHFVGMVIDPGGRHGDYGKDVSNLNLIGIHTKTESISGLDFPESITNMVKIRNSGKIDELNRDALSLLFGVKAKRRHLLNKLARP